MTDMDETGAERTAPRLTVTVDTDRCVASAYCVGRLPAVFDLDSDYATVLLPHPDLDMEEELRLAAFDCPSRAITVSRE